ncbi:glycosyltransferase [Sphingopyxis alaskensis]|jgi:glycosyltransferase involved in cell wall biosynthesis|uniref:Glycosyl transferase, group 1 n=1 Tax=Sphingopyxis alaskensis (strain DSM 13593 / LMG 18877 / RB2256) TaxID=317655 RepID=Q1GSE7_SPHAL|nr:glycosyltransferase [Sphingopyxis alaskensis]ABF53425.1 glycosyl transferase, group 1 [Sphingopyxis alaskensis RB2256]MCM3419867.1 glycosyltransferase [Sphingopyxis alaskensis]
MTPLRILSIATLFPDAARPSFGLFVEKSLRALAAQPGIELTVAAPLGLPPFPLSLHRRYRALRDLPRSETWNGLAVLRPRFPLIPKVGARFNPAAIARAVLSAVRDREFDVIDAQFFYPDGPAAMRVAGARGLPFSIKARGADIGHFGHAPATAAQVAAAAAKAAGLLAVSEAMRRDMAAIGIDPAKVAVHYTGIDATRFHPGDRAAARAALGIDDAPAILSVGALIPRKGQALVIAALPALPGVHYWLAGAGEEEGRYRALARRHGVEPRVHFMGPVANADLPQLYRAADVVVMPSASEGLANAWVEALACGTPIVISDAGGAAELVTAPAAGRIVTRTPGAIAEAVQEILAAPPSPTDVAASLDGRFDWNRNGRELAEHLRRCAGF